MSSNRGSIVLSNCRPLGLGLVVSSNRGSKDFPVIDLKVLACGY